MYVRKKKNKSGTTSVYVVDQNRGIYTLTKSFGVGSTQAEVELLEQRANQYVREATGKSLSLFEQETDSFPNDFISTLSDKQLQEVAPELFYGRIYDKIGYGRLQNEMFRLLVITRLLSPDNKLKTIDYLQRYIGANYGVNSIYRFLDNLCYRKKEKRIVSGKDIKRKVEEIAFAYTQKTLHRRIEKVFCHLMPLHFDAGKEVGFRKSVSSKSKPNAMSQLYLGILTTSDGYPIGFELFDESLLQNHSFMPAIQQLCKRFDLSDPVIVFDTIQLSKNNFNISDHGHSEYISETDPKNEIADIRRNILDLRLKEGNAAVIQRDKDCRLIISKSAQLAAIDRLKRERGLLRLQKKIEGGKATPANINHRGFNKYLKLKGKTKVAIDREKCKADAAWDGIKGYITNTMCHQDEIIEGANLFRFINQSFYMNRQDLSFRPVYHPIQNRIEAQTCIYFVAYVIMVELERLLNLSGSDFTLKQAQEMISQNPKTILNLNPPLGVPM
ncbi:MAG: hypothetical protein LBE79_02925 [Tannerella sp.]|jgi:hypothetical protein|nr:hypothetical protein [Tannerella sp.]